MDVFSFADKVLAPDSKAVRERAPLQAVLEITKRCNLRCNHCYIGDARWSADPDQIPTEEILALLKVMAAEGTVWLSITGGEPLAHPEFRRIWKAAFDHGFLLILYTNATLISAEMAGFLREFPPTRVEVSFYGATRETYERMTDSGSFDKFLRGLEQVVGMEVPWVAKTSLTVDTLPELDAMKAWTKSLGAPLFVNDHVYPSTGEGETSGKAPCAVRVTPEETAETRPPSEACGKHGESGRSRLFHCGAGETSFYVSSRGDIQMCNLATQRKESLRGNPAQRFRDAWAAFGEAREIQLAEGSPCRSCDIADLCQNCAAAAFLEAGDENAIVEHLCRKAHHQAHLSGRKHVCDVKHFVYRGRS